MDRNRLEQDGSSRINKALLKHGYKNFSITLLELPFTIGSNFNLVNNSVTYTHQGFPKKSEFLRKREDYYIEALKPQYNIKRYSATTDVNFVRGKYKINWLIPIRIKNLLDKCLDPKLLDYNLFCFHYKNEERLYTITATTPKGIIKAQSYG